VTGISYGLRIKALELEITASMGSGRGDRNQSPDGHVEHIPPRLQWGPVVVTGISCPGKEVRTRTVASMGSGRGDRNQSADELVRAGLADLASMGSGRGDRNQIVSRREATSTHHSLQWGPVVVTGISGRGRDPGRVGTSSFNGVRSW